MFDLDLRGVWDRISVEILSSCCSSSCCLIRTIRKHCRPYKGVYTKDTHDVRIHNATERYVFRGARCALTYLFHTLVCKPCQPRRTLLEHYMVADIKGRSSTGSSPIRILWTPIDSDSGAHIRVDVFRLGAGPDRDQPNHAGAAAPKQAGQATATGVPAAAHPIPCKPVLHKTPASEPRLISTGECCARSGEGRGGAPDSLFGEPTTATAGDRGSAQLHPHPESFSEGPV